MKIVVAPDSFKGNMRSARVCEIVKQAILTEMPVAEVITLPMADGGEGTVDAVVEATGGCFRVLEVSGPLGDRIEARYGILPDGTAVMEMAAASGIELVPEGRLDPMEATTYGTGELLRHLIAEGHDSIVMGIGGSATVDGGAGMAQALGFQFRTAEGEVILERGGKILPMIGSVDKRNILPGLEHTRIRVACDVTNPLTGADGAAAIFGPQKGASPSMVKQLDEGLANLRNIVGVAEAPGDGAAGGLGYGLRVFCGAEIVSGAHLIAETVGLSDALAGADLLITGEGRTDGQSLSGKLCPVIAGMARERGAKSMLISGALSGDMDLFLEVFDYAFSISAGHSSMAACIEHAPEDLRFLVRNLMRISSKS
ncbi:glycerate kinase [Verrucomicrobia bacterium S94]|nr:glycerate kinase [Verrucomicrobia bacterium S94]